MIHDTRYVKCEVWRAAKGGLVIGGMEAKWRRRIFASKANKERAAG
jgi:hypothetical protein